MRHAVVDVSGLILTTWRSLTCAVISYWFLALFIKADATRGVDGYGLSHVANNKAPCTKLQSWTLSSYISGHAVAPEGTFENLARLPRERTMQKHAAEHEYRVKAVPTYSSSSREITPPLKAGHDGRHEVTRSAGVCPSGKATNAAARARITRPTLQPSEPGHRMFFAPGARQAAAILLAALGSVALTFRTANAHEARQRHEPNVLKQGL